MAVIKAISSGASIKRGIKYITNPEKTSPELIAAIGCPENPETAWIAMESVKWAWHKLDGRQYKHFTYSFPPSEKITPEQALENAYKLFSETEQFKGHQMIIAVHTDTDHLHVHVIVNSVNMENGRKLQWSGKDLRELKERCNDLSREQGLSVPVKGKNHKGADREEATAWNKDTYQIMKKADAGELESYKERIARCVIVAQSKAVSREDFIEQLRADQIDVQWSERRKHITFIDLERAAAGEKKCKLRNTTMEKEFKLEGLGKEELEREFEANAKRTAEHSRAAEQIRRTASDRATGTENSGSAGADTAALIRELDAQERIAEEKRKRGETQRAVREDERKRSDLEAERRSAEEKRRPPADRSNGNRSKGKRRGGGPEL